MSLKLNQKTLTTNTFISPAVSQAISNKLKTSSLSPETGQNAKTKYIEYVNKKLITKSEDMKQTTPISKTKGSYNSSFNSTIQNKIKPSAASINISGTNYPSNNINNTTINNYISGTKNNPISLISSNFGTNSGNASFNLKNTLNLGNQKLTSSTGGNIPIFINPSTSNESYKISTKKIHSKEKSLLNIAPDPRFSNLETSDQEDELKLIATKKTEIEKKIFQLKKQTKTKSRSTNSKLGVSKSNTSTTNNPNTNLINDSFSNNLRTETINDKIIQNTFIQDNAEERKSTEFMNLRNINNNDTFFSNTDQKANTNQMTLIDTQQIPDEVFHNDNSKY